MYSMRFYQGFGWAMSWSSYGYKTKGLGFKVAKNYK